MSNENIVWNETNWKSVQKRIAKYQQRIYRASKQGNKNKVKGLQKRLIHSWDAKLLAVRRVTTDNRGRNTAGTDKKLYLTPEEKERLVRSLRIDGKAHPIRRVWIPKADKTKLRPLGIPVIKDRAKQSLVKLALEPEWEAIFEHNSYGFRPGRSCHDATEAIFASIHNTPSKYTHKYVLDADLKGCFDNINHDYLLKKLDTLPELETQTRAWLKAGIFEGYLTEDQFNIVPEKPLGIGTPQGGVISPFLANVALHGLENILKEWILTKPHFYKRKSKLQKQRGLTVVRYADDFVVIHPNKEIIQEAKQVLRDWLKATSGLQINEEKTKIVDTNQGFDFLGHRYITILRNGKHRAKIYPSRKNQARILLKIREVLQRNKAISTYELIQKLRPIILGWGNYYKYVESSRIRSKLDHRIYQQLRAWVFRRDKQNGRQTIKERYFPSGKVYTFNDVKHKDNWVLVGKQKGINESSPKEIFLPKLSWIHTERFTKIKGGASPYDGDFLYWTNRTANFGTLSQSRRKIYLSQEGKCAWCQTLISPFDIVEVDHIQPKAFNGKDKYNNLQILHRHCHIEKTRMERSNFPKQNG